MPKASESESAIAIVRMPPSTAAREWVPACKPTIKPSVVMTPEVNPKLSPVLSDDFIWSWCYDSTSGKSNTNARPNFYASARHGGQIYGKGAVNPFAVRGVPPQGTVPP